ncbi:MAG TPA: hypothetical protein VFS62_03240 [Chloroflexota bacterium]|jgi:hypothetical protein|nr:hypothetical protein [Chloroflexota bacterium]
MKATIITSSLAALSLAGMLTIPALADSSSSPSASATPATTASAKPHKDRGGCPDGFDAGDAAGVRVCRVGDGFRLETTDPAKSGAHEYTGTLTTDGKFTDVSLVRPENDDSASIDGNGNIVYDFKTYSGIDGIQFHVSEEAKEITFNVEVDGQLIPVNHIWIGDKRRHPDHDPFHIRVDHKDHGATPVASTAPTSTATAQ